MPVEGNGLNPLLQDPGLAFHPPTLYFGYVGISIAFSFAVGALVTRDVGPAFARAMRPWVLGAWIFLTLGITAGSYWAYYELGWGGWWFWDPVENASLMPWLAATALLHSVTVLATRDGLRAWTIMLAVVAFSMSMVGTFLVRSGILTSVHAFAVDPQRGAFILGLLALYIGGALALFGLRVGTVKEGSTFELVSREGALVVNNLLLSAILGIVLVGTLYPLVAEALRPRSSRSAPPYFNAARRARSRSILVAVMAVGAAAALAARRAARSWRPDRAPGPARRGRSARRCSCSRRASACCPCSGCRSRPASALASLAPLWKRNLRRTPLFTWGMVIAHLGIAVASPAWRPKAPSPRRPWSRRGPGADDAASGPSRSASTASSRSPGRTGRRSRRKLDGQPRRAARRFALQPQARMFSSPPTETSEAAIADPLDGQLYVAIGEADEQGRWQLRLWWKPFVTLIWLGGALVALGGLLALIGRLRRERRVARGEEALGMKRADPLGCRWRCSLVFARRRRRRLCAARRTSRSTRSMIGKPMPDFALPPARRRPARPRRAPTCARASRTWSTSSPAGACPAGPRRRSSTR